MKRYLEIIETDTGNVEESFDITDYPESRANRLEMGILINLDHDRFHTAERTEDTEEENK